MGGEVLTVVLAGPPRASSLRRLLWRLRDCAASPWAVDHLTERHLAHAAWRAHLLLVRLRAFDGAPPAPPPPLPAVDTSMVAAAIATVVLSVLRVRR